MDYVETTEEYSTFDELQHDLSKLMQRVKEIGARSLDVEVSVDLQAFTITIIAPDDDIEDMKRAI